MGKYAVLDKSKSLDFHGVPDLMDYTQEELMELFKTLPAPSLEEMQGEFHSTKLGHHSIRDWFEWHITCDNFILNPEWIGKAFHKVDDEHGVGYNLFRDINGKLYFRYPMYTMIAPSRYDAKPAYTLIYKAYYHLCAGTQMVDECRKLADGAYLLIGTYGFNKADRMRPHFWLLEGPYREYRGDVKGIHAIPRKFDKQKEMPNYGK